jgi:hypothetical protein
VDGARRGRGARHVRTERILDFAKIKGGVPTSSFCSSRLRISDLIYIVCQVRGIQTFHFSTKTNILWNFLLTYKVKAIIKVRLKIICYDANILQERLSQQMHSTKLVFTVRDYNNQVSVRVIISNNAFVLIMV